MLVLMIISFLKNQFPCTWGKAFFETPWKFSVFCNMGKMNGNLTVLFCCKSVWMKHFRFKKYYDYVLIQRDWNKKYSDCITWYLTFLWSFNFLSRYFCINNLYLFSNIWTYILFHLWQHWLHYYPQWWDFEYWINGMNKSINNRKF